GSWKVLGGVENAPVPSGGDEPKVDELPNGNIVISSRINGGRYFNIYTFTDKEAATGSWGSMATSNSANGGVVAQGNSCNGEIMMVPVVRNEDNKEMWLALQSLPFGNGRANVGIYYKKLETESDYNTPANFAREWDGRHQASYLASAYSTMCFQKDSTIAFLYEEDTYGINAYGGYNIMYKNYSIEQITNGKYTVLKGKEPGVEPEQPEQPGLPDEEKTLYRIKSVSQNKYLNIEGVNMNYSTGPKGSVGLADYAEDNCQIFSLEDAGNEKFYIVSADGYYIVCRQWNIDASNLGSKSPLGIEYKNDTEFYIVNGSQYFKVGPVDGNANSYYPYCDAPLSAAELWVLEEVGNTTAIEKIKEQRAESKEFFDLSGRKLNEVSAPGIYIVDGKKVLVK
ncbi:MAG: hypothetical protein IIW77_02705, partial [Bacteroidaceae bacterium]|nr:hypothetical protein [Bacteroidaceae bacterium]